MGDYLLLHIIGIIFAFASLVSSDEVLVVGETRELQVIPSLEVKGSPGLKHDIKSLCERIHIRGFPRFKHMDKYANSLKLIVNASTGGEKSSIHVCFHSNSTHAIGMCHHSQWKKVFNGSWIQTMIPFDNKILDVRIVSSSKVTLKVSTVEERFMFRIIFLIVGTILLSSASTLSRSITFYYINAVSIGLILFALLLLIQIMKHLPTRRTCWSLFLYLSLLCLGGVLPGYIPGLFQSMLRELELDKEMNTATATFLVLNLYMVGVSSSYYAIRGLVQTKDGSVDITTSLFVSWSIRILAAVLILQSSVDPLLAGGALISATVMSSMLKKITRSIFPLRLHEWRSIDHIRNCHVIDVKDNQQIDYSTTLTRYQPSGDVSVTTCQRSLLLLHQEESTGSENEHCYYAL